MIHGDFVSSGIHAIGLKDPNYGHGLRGSRSIEAKPFMCRDMSSGSKVFRHTMHLCNGTEGSKLCNQDMHLAA